jgi:hypothetical protein
VHERAARDAARTGRHRQLVHKHLVGFSGHEFSLFLVDLSLKGAQAHPWDSASCSDMLPGCSKTTYPYQNTKFPALPPMKQGFFTLMGYSENDITRQIRRKGHPLRARSLAK